MCWCSASAPNIARCATWSSPQAASSTSRTKRPTRRSPSSPSPLPAQRFGSVDAAINQSLALRSIPFTIIGTFKESIDTMGSTEIDTETVLIPYSVGRYFNGTDFVKQIFFSVRDQNDVEDAAKQIVRVVSSRHNQKLRLQDRDPDRGARRRQRRSPTRSPLCCCWSRP